MSAHGLRAQAEERRDWRRNRGEEEERESGKLVSGCSSRSDNDGAVLPCNAAGKFTSSEELFSINNSHMLRTARSELEKKEIINDLFS